MLAEIKGPEGWREDWKKKKKEEEENPVFIFSLYNIFSII